MHDAQLYDLLSNLDTASLVWPGPDTTSASLMLSGTWSSSRMNPALTCQELMVGSVSTGARESALQTTLFWSMFPMVVVASWSGWHQCQPLH